MIVGGWICFLLIEFGYCYLNLIVADWMWVCLAKFWLLLIEFVYCQLNSIVAGWIWYRDLNLIILIKCDYCWLNNWIWSFLIWFRYCCLTLLLASWVWPLLVEIDFCGMKFFNADCSRLLQYWNVFFANQICLLLIHFDFYWLKWIVANWVWILLIEFNYCWLNLITTDRIWLHIANKCNLIFASGIWLLLIAFDCNWTKWLLLIELDDCWLSLIILFGFENFWLNLSTATWVWLLLIEFHYG